MKPLLGWPSQLLSRTQGYHHTAPANATLFKDHKCLGRGCTCCQKTKLPLSLFCYFYAFIFNTSIFHSYIFQMGRNAFPRSTVYSSWAPQATAIWRNSFPTQFTCSFFGCFLPCHGCGKKCREIKYLTKSLQPVWFYLAFCFFFPDLSKAIPRKREQFPTVSPLCKSFLIAPSGSFAGSSQNSPFSQACLKGCSPPSLSRDWDLNGQVLPFPHVSNWGDGTPNTTRLAKIPSD